jgi:hypothetical protein
MALVASGALVFQASRAAFTATTSTGTNSWSSGSVVLGDDDSGTALFTANGLSGGETASRCIAVTYSGDTAATVRLYLGSSATTGTDLRPFLTLAVEEGTGGSFADCSGFTPTSALYTGTLTENPTAGDQPDWATDHPDYANGLSTWAPDGTAPDTRVYRFTYTLANDPAAQNKDATATFTWEAQG